MKAKAAKNFSENLDWLSEQPIDYRIAMIQQHLSVCQLLVNQIVTSSLIEYVGEKGSHQKPNGGEYSRYGYNPDSVRIGDQKVPVQVQRIKNNVTGETFKPEIYDQIKENTAGEERVRLAMLSGLSTRDYDKVMDLTSEAFGLSKSSLSKRFIEQTTRTLEEFQQRKYHSHNFVALQIDGISLGEQMMIICIGITDRGNKIPLDFVQSATENHRPVKDMLLAVKARGNYTDWLGPIKNLTESRSWEDNRGRIRTQFGLIEFLPPFGTAHSLNRKSRGFILLQHHVLSMQIS